MFKQASKMKLRFETSRGILSAEQLWDLKQSTLSTSIKHVKEILKKANDDDLAFLVDEQVVDVENQLRFDILKDVYLSKKKEAEERRNAANIKEHNEKILSIIADKQDDSLKDMSIEELQSQLKG